MNTVKNRCLLCGKPSVKNPEFFYTEGFYQMSIKVGSKIETYEICTKCNRCSLVKSRELNELFKTDKVEMYEKKALADLKYKLKLR